MNAVPLWGAACCYLAASSGSIESAAVCAGMFAAGTLFL